MFWLNKKNKIWEQEENFSWILKEELDIFSRKILDAANLSDKKLQEIFLRTKKIRKLIEKEKQE